MPLPCRQGRGSFTTRRGAIYDAWLDVLVPLLDCIGLPKSIKTGRCNNARRFGDLRMGLWAVQVLFLAGVPVFTRRVPYPLSRIPTPRTDRLRS